MIVDLLQRRADKEQDLLDRQYEDGLLTLAEYRKSCRDLQADLEQAMLERGEP